MLRLDATVDEASVARLSKKLGYGKLGVSALREAIEDTARTIKKYAEKNTPVYYKETAYRTKNGRLSYTKSGKLRMKRVFGGRAKKAWRITDLRAVQSGEATSYEVHVQNTATSDAGFPYPIMLEIGSGVGQRPWPRPGPRTKAGTRLSDGETRIFSRQAPGGMVGLALRQFNSAAVQAAIIRELKAALS